MPLINDILNKEEFSKQEIVSLLAISEKDEQDLLTTKAYSVKEKYIGRKAFVRGLIEFSNQCKKNCLYCGIRSGNSKVARYTLTDEEILSAVSLAVNNRYNGIVLQSGEISNQSFTKRITELIRKIKKEGGEDFRITLSLGEQSYETYREWFEAGAQRYLLRIETSNEQLYKKIHPDNDLHSFETRLNCLKEIQKAGYQTGTGVMIGLPFQTLEDLADDLLFLKSMSIDMVGMGPYIEHSDTPLYQEKENLLPLMERFNLSLRMISVLRLLMPFINIASTTALQSIFPMGREKGLKCGANILMPNLTPGKYRGSYLLYENKACIDEDADECLDCLDKRVQMVGEKIDYENFGDSKHYFNRYNPVS